MFNAYFPSNEEPGGGPEGQSGEEWIGSGTILVIDDEEMVREVAQMMIESFGFTVLVARDGIEGLAVVRDGVHLDLVLLDLTMPRMTGEETFQEIRKLRPELPVVLVSGYNEQEVNDQFFGRGIAGFIQKPFQLVELRDKLRAVVERGR